MARPVGSKVIECTKCGGQIVAKIGEIGVCKTCGAKRKFSLRLMKSLKKKLD